MAKRSRSGLDVMTRNETVTPANSKVGQEDDQDFEADLCYSYVVNSSLAQATE